MKSANLETIAAIATATGGGIGIVRMAGPAAEAIVRQLFVPAPEVLASHHLYYGQIKDPQSKEVVDDVLVCLMRAPHSYTGDDVVEIHGHGSSIALGHILQLAIACGARMAAPGEFTRRAFLAGKIDLTQAEAVAELIAARSDRQHRAAISLRQGDLARQVSGFRRRLIAVLAEVEGALDFPDEELDAKTTQSLHQESAEIAPALRLLASYYRRSTDELPQVVLAGRTNAGKSSLFNALCREERAIVDATPGTTRDVVEAEVNLRGLRVRIVDTGGERFSDQPDAIEARGIALGRRRRQQADVQLLVVDGTIGFTDIEERLWQEREAIPTLIVWNKVDVAAVSASLASRAPTAVSAQSGAGLPELEEKILQLLGETEEPALLGVNRRTQNLLTEAASAIDRSRALVENREPWEFAAVDLRRAAEKLGEITGESYTDDLLDTIFSRFCIGK